ncbi:MAG: hypothetical protein ACXAB4_04875 [Candidatus Hodarchaeales archaeon]|jgi:hypothetical protein
MSKQTRRRSWKRKTRRISVEEAKILLHQNVIRATKKEGRLINRLVKKTQSKRVMKPKRRADLRPSKNPKVMITSIGGVPVEGNDDGKEIE